MTVVAWDGKVLAADRRVDAGMGLIREAPKVFKRSIPAEAVIGAAPILPAEFFAGFDARPVTALCGISGNYAQGVRMLKWLEDGAYTSKFPKPENDDKWAELVVIAKPGDHAVLLHFGNCEVGVVLGGEHFAMGNGRDFALAAMHLGLDAMAAVGVASKLCLSCGNGFNAVAFGREILP